MSGLVFFNNVSEAIQAGYEILHPAIADSEGFLRARIMTTRGWAIALVKV
jgi:hypothetical protein